MIKLILITAAASFGFAFSAYAKTLTAEDFEQLVIGKSLYFETTNGITGKVKYTRSGRARLSKTNFDIKRDSGKWWFEGNKLCNQWKKVRNGEPRCTSWKTGPNGTYVDKTNGTIITVK